MIGAISKVIFFSEIATALLYDHMNSKKMYY